MSEVQQGGSEYRQQQLKQIVKDLHEGSDIKAVQRRFARLIRNVSPEEIARIEQALQRQKRSKVLPGHPVHTYLQENKALRRILKRMRPLLKQVPRGTRREELQGVLEDLKDIEIHYRRKENQLFPYLERVEFTGPSKVMWGKHDEIRTQLREFENACKREDWSRFSAVGRGLLRAVRRMIFMEEKILFPTSLKRLSEKQWAEIRQGEGEIGYAWVQPGNLWDPSVVIAASAAKELGTREGSGAATADEAPPAAGAAGEAPAEIHLDVGALLPQQINLMLKILPIDVTYVDENDRVRYYSQGRERIFPRSPAVIGRTVQNCHPPDSVRIVEKILESFKQKEKDTAEFWLTFNNRFIHIRYFALYDQEGLYRGVVEVSQDVTDIRELKGQRRLLEW